MAAETGNPLTTGVRFDPRGLVETLVAALPDGCLRLGRALRDDGERPVLATGGFAASRRARGAHIAPAAPLRLRGNPWSTGAGLEHALARGAALTAGMDEFYGRNMPDADWGERDYVAAAQLYARHARIFDERGEEFFRAGDVSWSETNVVQATARRPGARAYYLLDAAALDRRVRERTVRELVEAAPAAGARPARRPAVRRAARDRRRGARRRRDHAHDRRPARRRLGARARRRGRSDRRPLGGRGRRRRRGDGWLRERPRPGRRARPGRGRIGALVSAPEIRRAGPHPTHRRRGAAPTAL